MALKTEIEKALAPVGAQTGYVMVWLDMDSGACLVKHHPTERLASGPLHPAEYFAWCAMPTGDSLADVAQKVTDLIVAAFAEIDIPVEPDGCC